MKFDGIYYSLFIFCITVFTPSIAAQKQNPDKSKLKFAITFTSQESAKPIDGRMLLLISNDSTREPRFQIKEGPSSQLVFGKNVNELKPDETTIIDNSAYGYPLKSISQLPPGEYYVQALLNIYETFHLANGHTVKLPPDRGEGQQWNKKPGNFYSTPQKIYLDPKKDQLVKITLNKIISPIPEPKSTKWIKFVKIKSKLLTKFYGKPMFLSAFVLLPKGFNSHPKSHYPLMVFHGHFPRRFFEFRTTPPDSNLKSGHKSFHRIRNYRFIREEYAYKFYKKWISPDFPRMLIIQIRHANPYFDDSYAVNSANVGPYGDAINHELIPYIEKKFRGIGQGWARFTYGGSTGGWEALATQIFYPDMYNGCFAACPDPVDFRKYGLVNIYKDSNAFFIKSPWMKTDIPEIRNTVGQVFETMREANREEMALGTKSRSGQQWDIWQAVFSPVGKDGYPKPIWNRYTGTIDHSVAEYWKKHFDLRYILQHNWKNLGPKLKGKIHIYVGTMDTYYLNDAVYLMEDFLKKTKDPYYDGVVDYGDREPHGWNGDHKRPLYIANLRYNLMYVPMILKRMLKTAPPGADTTSWRYK